MFAEVCQRTSVFLLRIIGHIHSPAKDMEIILNSYVALNLFEGQRPGIENYHVIH